MTSLSDGLRDVLLAGIGAMSVTGDKAKEVVDQLIERGELTVDQGKQINTELKHKVEEAATTVRYEAIEARLSLMSTEERAEFMAKVADLVAKLDAKAEAKVAEEAAVAADSPVLEVDAAALAAQEVASAEK